MVIKSGHVVGPRNAPRTHQDNGLNAECSPLIPTDNIYLFVYIIYIYIRTSFAENVIMMLLGIITFFFRTLKNEKKLKIVIDNFYKSLQRE